MSLHTLSSDQPFSGDLRQYERQTLESLATGLPLTQVLHALLQRVEALAQVRLHACILLLSEDGRYLQDGIAPSLPDAYSRDLGRLEIGPLAGSCGTAAYRREAVYVEDIACDPLWAGARDLALRYGLRACWSMPLLALDGRLLGTFANYFLEPRRPLAAERDAFRLVTETAALAIERHQADLLLRESEDHYRHLVELNPQYTWTCDPGGRRMVFSPRWQQLTAAGTGSRELLGAAASGRPPDDPAGLGRRAQRRSGLRPGAPGTGGGRQPLLAAHPCLSAAR